MNRQLQNLPKPISYILKNISFCKNFQNVNVTSTKTYSTLNLLRNPRLFRNNKEVSSIEVVCLILCNCCIL